VSDDPLAQVNRFAIIVAAMVVAFVALLIVLLAWGAADESIKRIADLAGYLRRHNDGETKIIITLAAAVVVLLMLTAIIVEVTPSPTQKMRVRNLKSGDATITTKQIAERIEAEVLAAPHIAQCRATVAARGKRVEVVLDLHVGPGAKLAQTADDACHRAHVLVEERLGIEMAARPRARLHYRELRLRGEMAEELAAARSATGWERPAGSEGERDERGQSDTPEEAQA
jgi:hypothetical protein